MNANARFIQIACDSDSIHALDEYGRVWFFDYEERLWRALSAERDLRDNEEWNTTRPRRRT